MVYTKKEYYLAFQRILTHVITWMKLNVMLREISRMHTFVTKGQKLYDFTFKKGNLSKKAFLRNQKI